MDWTLLWWVLSGLIVIAGLAGTVVPALPGVPLVLAGLWLAAWAGDYQVVGWGTIGVLAILTAIAWFIDLLAGALGAKRLGASPRAFWGATIGAIVGIFFGLAGILLGPFIGAVIAEISGGRKIPEAGKAGLGTWIGLVIGTAAKLAIAFLMVGVFAFKYFI